MTGNAQVIDNNLSEEWLTARPGERFCIRVPATATGGTYGLTEIISSPGDSTPIHLHEKEDEYFLVLEGTIRFLYGDKTFDAEPGTMVTCLRNIAHAWGNATDKPVRMIGVTMPGGCEEALRTIAKGGDKVDVMALANSYSVRVLGPPFLSK
jgi:mannose-6-phosphate isomerase-like protein (cupin superfamily)